MTVTRIDPGFRTVAMPDGPAPEPLSPKEAASRLAQFVDQYPRLLVLTGAGISTHSGIPDYRDGDGGWKRRPPVQHQQFMSSHAIRQRYWARSLIGWPVMRNSRPNAAHKRLAALEQQGSVPMLVTQNVDRLHQRAGSESVIDLHGRADEALCMSCGFRFCRYAQQWQKPIATLNLGRTRADSIVDLRLNADIVDTLSVWVQEEST